MADKSGIMVLGAGLGGAFVGSMFGMPQLGFILGAMLGSMLFPADNDAPDMPRAASYPVQQSCAGNPIAVVYGTDRLAGNVVWMGPLVTIAIEQDSGGGKAGGSSGPSSTTIVYRRSFLIAVCHGPVELGRVWRGKEEIDITALTWFEGFNNEGIELLTGDEFTKYRHVACAFFEDYFLGQTQTIPNFVFEVNANPRQYPTLQELTPAEIPAVPDDPATVSPSGTGSITSKSELQGMAGGGDYALGSDINISGGWTPIVDFAGTLNGNGYTISNLEINDPDHDDQGIFANLKSGARIHDLTINGATVAGKTNVGVLVGRVGSGWPTITETAVYPIGAEYEDDIVIKNVHIVNAIVAGVGSDSHGVGGLGGHFTTFGNVKIFDCTINNAIIQGKEWVGGLLGVRLGLNVPTAQGDQVVRCSAGDVSATTVTVSGERVVGGLIGWVEDYPDWNDDRGIIHTCYSKVAITPAPGTELFSYVGGLFGSSAGLQYTTCNAYVDIVSAGTIGVERTGGFAGNTSCYDTLIDCGVEGAITVNTDRMGSGGGVVQMIGGFCGECDVWYSRWLRCWSDVAITVNQADYPPYLRAIGGLIGWIKGANVGDAYPFTDYFYEEPSLGLISRCFAWGDISLYDMSNTTREGVGTYGAGVGGFIGTVDGPCPTLENCYSWSAVICPTERLKQSFGDWGVGGLIGNVTTGAMKTDAHVENVYHALGVLPSISWLDPTDVFLEGSPIGGLTGVNQYLTNLASDDTEGKVVMESSYWDQETSADDGYLTIDDSIGSEYRLTIPMKTESNYEGWNFDTIWYMPDRYWVDANPADIIYDLLTNSRYGAGISPAWVDKASFVTIHDYCEAEDFLISIVIDQQKFVGDWIDHINTYFRGFIFMSQGKIHLGAFRDESPVFTIEREDLVITDADTPEAPVKIKKRDYSDTANKIELSWQNRSLDYKVSIAVAVDVVDNRVSGKPRKRAIQLAGVKREILANKLAYYTLFDSMYRYTYYTFVVSYKKMRIEVGDVGTLSDGFKVDNARIRIISVAEDKDGRGRTINAIEDVASLYHAVDHITQQESERDADTVNTPDPVAGVEFQEYPTDSALAISITPGSEYANGFYIYRSYDGITYDMVGRTLISSITGGSANSTGTLSKAMPVYPSAAIWLPDDEMYVNIGTVTGLDTAITLDDVFRMKRLIKVGDEIISYYECDETEVAGVWRIRGLLRGAKNTDPAAHAPGEAVSTLDVDFTYFLKEEDIGSTLYFKTVAFYADHVEDISTVTAYSYFVDGKSIAPLPVSYMRINGREHTNRYPTDNVTIDWFFCSKTSGYGRGGWGVALWGNYVQDPALQYMTVDLYDVDGTLIVSEVNPIATYGTPPQHLITLAERSGENPIIVKMTPGSVIQSPESREIVIINE